MKKGEIYEGIIEKVEFPNKGFVWVDDQKVIVKNGIPGQKVRFMINKKRSGRAEGRLLEVLLQSPDTVIHRPILFSKVWGTDAPVEESNLDTYVHFVRKRLKQTGSALSLLTIRGSGYKLSQ